MSRRPADLRFVLPERVHRAVVLGSLPGWRAALVEAGVSLADGASSATPPPDLVVATPRMLRRAAGSGAGMVIVTGWVPALPLARAGYSVERLVVRPGRQGPQLVMPIGPPDALRRMLRGRPGDGSTVMRRARNLVVAEALAAGVPAGPAAVTVGLRHPGPPFLLRAAGLDAGGDGRSWWSLALGSGDELQRALFHITDPAGGGDRVVKFSRVPGHAGPFDADERALGLVAALAPRAAVSAPRLLGRLRVEGIEASVETAAAGRPMNQVLAATSPAQGFMLVEQVAAWTIALGLESQVGAGEVAGERRRLAEEVVPAWAGARLAGARAGLAAAGLAGGESDGLVAAVGRVPGVLQHNDLGSWNILADGPAFTVIDWESARHPGLPLWDLLYFLGDALVALHRPRVHGLRHQLGAQLRRAGGAGRLRRVGRPAGAHVPGPPPHGGGGDDRPGGDDGLGEVVRLFRGQHPGSGQLFRWVRAAASSFGLRPREVGAVATLCWMHHGLSHLARAESLGRLGDVVQAAPLGPLQRLGEPWLVDPLLGPRWDRWR